MGKAVRPTHPGAQLMFSDHMNETPVDAFREGGGNAPHRWKASEREAWVLL